MATVITRNYVMFTDDEHEAFAELMSRRESAGYLGPARYRGWDMATVADMTDPPKTDKRFCVFQIKENK